MSFDWSEYLNVAKELAGVTTTPANQEAKLRAAISRAYYAAFINARNHLGASHFCKNTKRLEIARQSPTEGNPPAALAWLHEQSPPARTNSSLRRQALFV